MDKTDTIDEFMNESLEADSDISCGESNDSFSLKFTISQWKRLVLNADELFVSLGKQGFTDETREKIEEWRFLKQECEDCLSNDESGVKNETSSFGTIDEDNELASKASLAKSDSETDFSDSGAEIDGVGLSSQAEQKKYEFSSRPDLLVAFIERNEMKIAKCVGHFELYPLPRENPRIPANINNILKNQRRKSILSSCSNNFDLLPVTDVGKKEFYQQSKNKIKNFFRHLRKQEEPNNEESKKPKDKLRMNVMKSDKEHIFKFDENNSTTKCIVHKQSHVDKEINYCAHIAIKTDSDKMLRNEIAQLRITRDFLSEQRKTLDVRLNKEKIFTDCEQRRFIELDEAIDAVDSSIEFKNSFICGHTIFEGSRDEGEHMLLDCLMKLSETELKLLLFKYFQKTIDLREWARKKEQEVSELDYKIEAQTFKIQLLSGTLHQVNTENNRKLATVHRQHEERLNLMFRHYTGINTSDNGNAQASDDRRAHPLPSLNIASIPQKNLRVLQSSSSGKTTKVTRNKNKLIIQRQKE